MLLLILAAAASVASARPSFIAVPADQIAFLDLSALHVRRPRQTLEPPPPPPQRPQVLYQEQYQPIAYAPSAQLQLQQDYQPIPIHHYPPQPIPVGQQLGPQLGQQLGPQLGQQLGPQLAAQPTRLTQPQQDSSDAASALSSRPPDFGEYVDFGAHTGDSGAFGWYADYPVNDHENGYRK